MGTTKVWLYPHAYSASTEIDFGETLSDLQFNYVPNVAISEGASGQLARTQFNGRGMVRAVHERTTDAALVRKLYLLENYLKSGGIISLAVDSAQAWAGYTTVQPTRGTTTISVHGGVWPFVTTPDLSSGAELELMSSQPYGRREFLTNDGGTVTGYAAAVTVSSVEYAYREEPDVEWCLLRHRGFWPALRLSKEAYTTPIVTHDHQISYTFDAQLEEAIDVLEAAAATPTESHTVTEVNGWRTNNQISASESQRPVQTGFGPLIG